MALGDIVFVDSSVAAIQAYSEKTTDLQVLQLASGDEYDSALISGTITKSPQSIIRARPTMGESFSPSIPSKAWAVDINLELRVDGYQTGAVIIPILNKVIPPQAGSDQWLLRVALQAHAGDISATNPAYLFVVAIDSHAPINPGDSSAEQTFTLSGGAFKYREATTGTFDATDGTGVLQNHAKWPAPKS